MGIGIGYAIWYGSEPAKATAEPRKPSEGTSDAPKPVGSTPKMAPPTMTATTAAQAPGTSDACHR